MEEEGRGAFEGFFKLPLKCVGQFCVNTKIRPISDLPPIGHVHVFSESEIMAAFLFTKSQQKPVGNNEYDSAIKITHLLCECRWPLARPIDSTVCMRRERTHTAYTSGSSVKHTAALVLGTHFLSPY